jgi:hypothetical protein
MSNRPQTTATAGLPIPLSWMSQIHMTIEKVRKVNNFLRINLRAIATEVAIEAHDILSVGDTELLELRHVDFILEELTLKMVKDTLWTGFAVHVHDGNKEKSEVFTKYVAQGKFFEGSAIGDVVKDYTNRNMGIAMALSQVFSRAMTQMTESIFEEYLRQN